jgi:pimeloyl-ACP methyl ester carboxylesterase
MEEGWCVLSMDQRGHGGASPVTDVGGFGLDAMGADLLAMMDDAGWESAWLGGGSLGAATSLAASAQAPSRVEGLALIAPAIGRTPSAARRDRFGPIARAFAEGGTEAGIAAWGEQLAAGEPVPQHVETMRSTDPRVLAALLEAISAWTMSDEIDAVAALDVPVIVMAWDGDEIHPMSAAEDIVARAAERGHLHRITPDDPAGPLGMFVTLARLLEEQSHRR